MNKPAEQIKYRMSFGTGGLFLNESVAIARLYEGLRDWTAVKNAAAEQAIIPFRKNSSVTRAVREIANRLEVLRPNEMEVLAHGEYHDQLAVLWLALCRCYRFIGEFAVRPSATNAKQAICRSESGRLEPARWFGNFWVIVDDFAA